jgi:cell division protein FtsB
MSDAPDLVPLKLKTSAQTKKQGPLGGMLVYLGVFFSFFVILMFVSKVYVKKYAEMKERGAEIKVLQDQVRKLELENRQLFRQIEELKTPLGQEKTARKKLKLIRPGEKIVEWKRTYKN